MIDVAERRQEIEADLDALRQARGVAMLDGKEFDVRPLNDLQGQLDALNEAEGEQARREREKIAIAEAKRIEGLKQTLREVNEQRLEAVDRAEKAARELAAAICDVLDRSKDATGIMRGLGVNTLHLDRYETEMRLSLRLRSALVPVTGLGNRFGQINLPAARTPYDEPWKAAEQTIGNPDIKRALEN